MDTIEDIFKGIIAMIVASFIIWKIGEMFGWWQWFVRNWIIFAVIGALLIVGVVYAVKFFVKLDKEDNKKRDETSVKRLKQVQELTNSKIQGDLRSELKKMDKDGYRKLKQRLVERKNKLTNLTNKEKEVIIDKWIDEITTIHVTHTPQHKTKPKRVPIPTQKRIAVFRAYHSKCAMCQKQEHLEIHHIDGDRSNNKSKNLIAVCPSCHRKSFTKEQFKAVWKEPIYSHKKHEGR